MNPLVGMLRVEAAGAAVVMERLAKIASATTVRNSLRKSSIVPPFLRGIIK
jgi:hypothetical protein